jgi:Spy/CpxP family protein refolding chaperone
MKLNKLSMIVALVVGSLLACTTLATAQETNTPPPKGKRNMMTVDQQLDMMKQRLNLTDEQVPKVKAALEDRNKQMAEIRQLPQDERREKMMALRDEQSKKMKGILTPDQYTKYESMLQQGKKGGGGGGGKKSE